MVTSDSTMIETPHVDHHQDQVPDKDQPMGDVTEEVEHLPPVSADDELAVSETSFTMDDDSSEDEVDEDDFRKVLKEVLRHKRWNKSWTRPSCLQDPGATQQHTTKAQW